MDRKPGRKRLYLLFCLAALAVLALASCAPVTETVVIKEKEVCSPRHQDFLQALSAPSDFDAAIQVNHDILSASPKDPQGEEALLYLGLIYAHPDYPKKDYRKSLGYFRRLLRDFPNGPAAPEAKIWIGILEDIEKVTRVDKEIEEKKKQLTK